ncbi:MAG: PEP-CTERM sorting domain-containing protein [Roseateles sp.]|nr:MAG: PEP-CTERM sorting domain-containing protein [Roseateles sp.]
MIKHLAAAAAACLACGQVAATTFYGDRASFDARGAGSAYFNNLDEQGDTAPLPFGFGPLSFSGSFGNAFYWASDWHENAPGVNGNVDGTAWVQVRLNTFTGALTLASDEPLRMLGLDLRPYFDASGNSDGGETVRFSTDTGESGSFQLPATNSPAFLGLVFDAPVTAISFSIGADHGNGFTWFGIDNLQTYSAVSAVPEPASVALLLAGLGGVGLAARRRRAG